MSYDLVFWRQAPDEARSPRAIFEAIAESRSPAPGLPPLPIEPFLSRCLDTFPTAARAPNGALEWIVLDDDAEPWMFEMRWSDVHVWVTLRGDWPGEVANKIVDLALEIDCPLYDPQTSERFG